MKKSILIFMALILLPASLQAGYSKVAEISQPNILNSVSITKDGTVFAFSHKSANNNNEDAISFWNIETPSPPITILAPPSQLATLQHGEHKFAFHFHSRHLVERNGLFYKVAQGANVRAEFLLAGPFPNVLQVTKNSKIVLTRPNQDSETVMAISPRGTLLAVSVYQENRVEIVDLDTQEIAALPSEPQEIVGPIKMVFFFTYKASLRVAVVYENTTMIYRKDRVRPGRPTRTKRRG
jgi:hypothetical protein